jgi:hypothetical protein
VQREIVQLLDAWPLLAKMHRAHTFRYSWEQALRAARSINKGTVAAGNARTDDLAVTGDGLSLPGNAVLFPTAHGSAARLIQSVRSMELLRCVVDVLRFMRARACGVSVGRPRR